MNKWLTEFSNLIHTLLGSPASNLEFAILLAVVVAGLMLSMYIVGASLRIPNRNMLRISLALTFGVLLLISAWASTHTYILPLIKSQAMHAPLMYGIPIIAGLLIVIPIQQLIFRSSYVATLITFAASLALAGLLVVLTTAILGAALGGEHESNSIRKQRDATNRFLDSE